MTPLPAAPRVHAVLGPTNTGKTRLAVERMLGHASGIIGCPLRLLAREIYDRIVEQRGAASAALVTGEERIVPPRARYYAATVEAMPQDLAVEFLAVDEIQLAADPERGHIFTDRLLHARGAAETMFLGADTMRRLLRRLVPGIRIETRPRLSALRHGGHRKLTRLPRRSAAIAFSLPEVYRIAELLRRRHGGAAVVLGALSPKTRNAQVAMYEAGEVDHLVATDAIGMGLNMDIAHVAFAARRKFDGRGFRDLAPAELGQIAGRAGRHAQDGTFGTAGACPPFEDPLVAALEEHAFEPLRRATWRSRDLEFASVDALRASLEAPAPEPWLARVRGAEDERALRDLAAREEVAARADSPDRVRLLWHVASIPDFRNHRDDTHAALLAKIFLALTGRRGILPSAWTHARVEHLNRLDGDLDALMTRLEHVRVWSYVAQRGAWVEDSPGLKERTRETEDRLSDALHRALAQRFVDRRTATLVRRMKDPDDLVGSVRADGEVRVEGEYVGMLRGFRFLSDGTAYGPDARAILAAARQGLNSEIRTRARTLAKEGDGAFELGANARVLWSGAEVARLAAGDSPWRPRVVLEAEDLLSGRERQAVGERLQAWLGGHVEHVLAPLFAPARAELRGAARGIAWRLQEEGGVIDRRDAEALLAACGREDRRRLREAGVRIGRAGIRVEAMPGAARELAWLLVSVHLGARPAPLPEGAWHAAKDHPRRLWPAGGFLVVGEAAGRADALEDLAEALAPRAAGGAFAHDTEAETGLPRPLAESIVAGLGYRRAATQEGQTLWTRRPPRSPGRARPAAGNPDSPFAVLAGRLQGAR